MLFCNLTPLDGRFVHAIVFCRKSDFCEYITSLHIQHSIYVRQFEFFVFTMKQIASIFCNVTFAGQNIFRCLGKGNSCLSLHKSSGRDKTYVHKIPDGKRKTCSAERSHYSSPRTMWSGSCHS